jgi:hypothetical protein
VVTAGKSADLRFRPILLFIAMPLFAACTFIGVDNPSLRRSINWGPQQRVLTCVYLDEGVSKENADQLLGWWNNREGNWYKLDFVPASYEPLKRDSGEFFFFQISSKLQSLKRPDRCIKQIWFVSRNLSDLLYGGAANVLGLPEVVGWTDDDTRSKAWTYANVVPDLNQLVMSPGAATRHEIYHLLGCDHFDVNMGDCYEEIQNFKAWEREYFAAGSDIKVAKFQQPIRASGEDAAYRNH